MTNRTRTLILLAAVALLAMLLLACVDPPPPPGLTDAEIAATARAGAATADTAAGGRSIKARVTRQAIVTEATNAAVLPTRSAP